MKRAKKICRARRIFRGQYEHCTATRHPDGKHAYEACSHKGFRTYPKRNYCIQAEVVK